MTFTFHQDFSQWKRFHDTVNRGASNWDAIRNDLVVDVGFIIHDGINNDYRTEVASGYGHRAPAFTTGMYGSMLQIVPRNDGVTVNATAHYAGALEEGSKPHWPPRDLIDAWLQAKGWDNSKRVVNAVAYHISLMGTPPRNFVKNVFHDLYVLDEINARINHAMDALAFSVGFASSSGSGGGLAKDARGFSISPRTGKSFYNVRAGDVGAGGNPGRFARRS